MGAKACKIWAILYNFRLWSQILWSTNYKVEPVSLDPLRWTFSFVVVVVVVVVIIIMCRREGVHRTSRCCRWKRPVQWGHPTARWPSTKDWQSVSIMSTRLNSPLQVYRHTCRGEIRCVDTPELTLTRRDLIDLVNVRCSFTFVFTYLFTHRMTVFKSHCCWFLTQFDWKWTGVVPNLIISILAGAGFGFGDNSFFGSQNNTPDETNGVTNGVNNVVNCYKAAIQFSASFVTSLFARFWRNLWNKKICVFRPGNTV